LETTSATSGACATLIERGFGPPVLEADAVEVKAVDEGDDTTYELYVDGDPEVWERTPQAMVCSNPFLLE
jgi:hypothetical protein